MCGRFTLTTPDQDLMVQFNLPEIPDIQPRYNIAPTQSVPAVRIAAGGDRELALLRWGLIPFWAPDATVSARMINARSETAAVKPAFRAAFRQRRCLVLADGFYEWQKVDGGKQPYLIRLRTGDAFAFAGLWERWRGPEGVTIESCTLLTTTPNDLILPLHNRMPVILDPRDYGLWLDPASQTPEPLAGLLRPYPSDLMTAYPVSRAVNNPKAEGPHLAEALPHGESRTLPGF